MADTKTMTLKAKPDIYGAVRLVCGKLQISVQEFLRRAVVRVLLYNGKKVK